MRRDLVLAAVVGALCYTVSCLIIAPGDAAKGFGIEWQMMSERPFALVGRLPHRILAPLLAHALGCGGERYLLFVRGLAILLLGTVFFFCRRRHANVFDAGLITLAIALTAAVQLYKDHWVGYPDALCYAMCFWLLLAARHTALFWGLFFVNLLNHELVAFLLPWLWFVRREVRGSWLADVVGAATALGLYAAFYLWVKATAQDQLFNAGYFASHPLFPGGTFVVCCLALSHLVCTFGPILAVLAWHQHTRAHGRERLHAWLIAAGVAMIFTIAYDWARHSNFVIVPLVLASLRFLAAGHRAVYAGLLAIGVGLMLLVPPWAPTAWPTDAMANLPFLVSTGVVVIENKDYFTGTLASALTSWLPAVLPLLSALIAIAVAIWLAGFAFARSCKDRMVAPPLAR